MEVSGVHGYSRHQVFPECRGDPQLFRVRRIVQYFPVIPVQSNHTVGAGAGCEAFRPFTSSHFSDTCRNMLLSAFQAPGAEVPGCDGGAAPSPNGYRTALLDLPQRVLLSGCLQRVQRDPSGDQCGGYGVACFRHRHQAHPNGEFRFLPDGPTIPCAASDPGTGAFEG